MKGKVSRCKIYFACWCMTIFCMTKMFYAFFLCIEFRILASGNVILDQKKWSITGIYRNSLGNTAFGSDSNSILKTTVMIQLFDAEVKHRNYWMPLWLQSQSCRFLPVCLNYEAPRYQKIRIIHHEMFLCQC